MKTGLTNGHGNPCHKTNDRTKFDPALESKLDLNLESKLETSMQEPKFASKLDLKLAPKLEPSTPNSSPDSQWEEDEDPDYQKYDLSLNLHLNDQYTLMYFLVQSMNPCPSLLSLQCLFTFSGTTSP